MRKTLAACVVAAFMAGGVLGVASGKQPNPTPPGNKFKCKDGSGNGGVAGPGKKGSPECTTVTITTTTVTGTITPSTAR